MKLVKIMALAGVAKSNSEARRLIQQGAVEVDQQPMKDVKRAADREVYSEGRKEAVCEDSRRNKISCCVKKS